MNVADFAESAAGIARVEPEDIARCVAFLASDDSGFSNGSTISAYGPQFFSQGIYHDK